MVEDLVEVAASEDLAEDSEVPVALDLEAVRGVQAQGFLVQRYSVHPHPEDDE